MTASNLALATPNPHVADIGLPKQKTVSDLEAERAILEAELATCNALALERGARSYRVQHATTQVALGNGSKADLQAAQNALDESIEALIRRDHLQGAISEMNDQIRFVAGQERRHYCESVKKEFDDLHASYVADCHHLHEKFRQLHQLHVKYQGLVARPLLDELSYRLHLPPLIGQYDNVNIATGTKVR